MRFGYLPVGTLNKPRGAEESEDLDTRPLPNQVVSLTHKVLPGRNHDRM
jgi:hypothetical protein